MMTKLVFGCGYLGERVARLWAAAGAEVCVVTRSDERAAEFARRRWNALVGDILAPESLPRLPLADTVLFAVGYDRRNAPAGPSIEEVYVRGLRATLEALPAGVERFIYISSTGVYGQTDGGVVDEDSPCNPERHGGRACLAAERLLAESPVGDRAIVLRLAGLYGPGRIPRQRELLSGEPFAAPVEGSLNLIHVDDAARTVLAAERAQPPRTYIVSDGHPVNRREYYEEVARRIGAPSPQFVAARADSPAAERATANKRLSNARLLAELDVKLEYPNYRLGLAAALAAEQAGESAIKIRSIDRAIE